jgi:glycosyltransferase involved in cell wall biosynthesis
VIPTLARLEGEPAPRHERDTRIRILHVLATLLPGGSEISVLRLLSALERSRYVAHVACLRGEPALADEFRAAGIEVVSMGMRSKVDPACLFRLRRFVKDHRIDVVHTHMDVADFYGALAGRLGGARCIVSTKHAPDEFRTRRGFKRYPFLLLERLAYEMDDAVIVVSEGLGAFLEKAEHLPRRKMVVIGHGIDSSTRLAPPSEARRALRLPLHGPVMGAVGRLSPEKGQSVLLRALPSVLATFPDAICVVAGEGPARDDLESEARRLGIRERVVFLGFRRDVPVVLAALDLFVQPSLYEGFGLSLLEAMAAELPIVASRVGGIPELIEDGVTGVLVPPDAPAALSEAILRLLRDRDAARRLGEGAARRARERHSLGTMAARVDRVYRDVLERRR